MATAGCSTTRADDGGAQVTCCGSPGAPGPDGVGDYMPRRSDPCYVGSGTLSQEASGGLDYLTRAPPPAPGVPGVSGVLRSRPPPQVGSVGWGWRYNQWLNRTTLLSNMQIQKTEIRTGEENMTQ
ncbi:unnamed protein product [Lota lota]